MLQSQTPLLDALKSCALRPHAAFYTPGHKRGQGAPSRFKELIGMSALAADLPELPELDNLFAPQGAIQAAQELAATAFGADRTWFLANGSTSGVIAAILATCAPGDRLILPRNVHQSAISALILAGVIPIFVHPDYDPALDLAYSLTPEGLTTAIGQYPEARAVLLVSPTYQGFCGDVATLAQIAHHHGIPLIVDEAHGPHFGFHPALPASALSLGADIAIQSTHKVLSALTQASMLHLKGNRVDPNRLSRALQLIQSTSPNYLLLASLDAARQQMATQGWELLERTLQLANRARQELAQIPGLAVLGVDRLHSRPGFFALDPTRLTLIVTGLGIDGFTADEILHQQFAVTAECPSWRHLTFILSSGNTAPEIDQLIAACTTLAKSPLPDAPSPIPNAPSSIAYPPITIAPREAFFAPKETLPFHQAVGRISAELVCPYPPGIPILLPGEAVTAAALDALQQVLVAGGMVSGCADPSLQTIQVCTL